MDYMTMNFNRNGGGGTSDYSQLTNKPSINDVTLAGNKTASDLGLMPAYEVDTTPTESSENLITSGAVYEADQSINGKLQGAKTVSGNPITVSDAEPMNAESVVVELEPKQDLHGYGKPWAGGAGKNIANQDGTDTSNGYVHSAYISVYGDVITASSTWDVMEYVPVEPNTTYTISGISVTTASGWAEYDINKERVKYGAANISPLTFTTGESTRYIRFGRNYTTDNQVQIELGQTATDFEPYSNICPISGYSEVNVENNTDTYTVSLGGTKYGGILDVTEGDYSDEWGYIEGDSVSDLVSAGMSSDTTSAGLYCMVLGSSAVSQADDQPATSDKLVCNDMENITANQSWNTNVSGVCINQVGHVIFTVKDITTQQDMDTWLSNNPIQIAYRKKTPTSVSTTPTDITLLENTNNISTDGTNLTLKYQPNNVIGECKAYTDEQVQKVLPTPPTTDGTYHLECSVSGGIPTISWVLNS